jgi:hypothetical protein
VIVGRAIFPERTLSGARAAIALSNIRKQNMAIEKATASSSLAEVIDRILDKGVVIDAFVRVSLVGIELLSIELRAVVASVETWLKYAEAIGLVAQPMPA